MPAGRTSYFAALAIARAALAPLSIQFKRLFAMSERAGPDHTLLGTTNEPKPACFRIVTGLNPGWQWKWTPGGDA